MKKTKVKDATGKEVSATIVDVDSVLSKASEIQLEDGAKIRAQVNILEVARVDGQEDRDGNPVYLVKNHVVLSVVKKPDLGPTEVN